MHVCLVVGGGNTSVPRCAQSPWTEIQVSRDSLTRHSEPGMQLALSI